MGAGGGSQASRERLPVRAAENPRLEPDVLEVCRPGRRPRRRPLPVTVVTAEGGRCRGRTDTALFTLDAVSSSF